MKKTFLKAENRQNRERTNSDLNRLGYHLMAPVGWLNDPNGLCEINGIYHIFYQYCPMSASGNGLKGWGHYSTPDFVHFREEDIALLPDSEIDSAGAYSGSAFQKDGTTHFFYTGNGKLEGNYDYINEGRLHWTNHFSTRDGKSFTDKKVLMKNEDYPADLSCHVRDPKIVHEPGSDTFYMVLGARTRNSEGEVDVFKSQDLEDWKPVSRIRPEKPFGYMWECPDLFELDGQNVLITCPQGVKQDGIHYENIYQNGYFLTGKDLEKDQTVRDFRELDHGFDFYAPQTFEDEKGRRILIGWMGIPDADYDNNPTLEYGWQHALTIPRVLHLRDGRIYQTPIEEMKRLRAEEITASLQPGETMELPWSSCEISVKTDGQPFDMIIRKDVELSYDGSVFALNLHGSGQKRTVRHVKIEHLNKMRIFSDTSSLEIFLNDGEETMTTRVYDDQKDLIIRSSIPAAVKIYRLNPYQIEYK